MSHLYENYYNRNYMEYMNRGMDGWMTAYVNGWMDGINLRFGLSALKANIKQVDTGGLQQRCRREGLGPPNNVSLWSTVDLFIFVTIGMIPFILVLFLSYVFVFLHILVSLATCISLYNLCMYLEVKLLRSWFVPCHMFVYSKYTNMCHGQQNSLFFSPRADPFQPR